MWNYSLRRLARRKHGQKSWSPNSVRTGAGPANLISTSEILEICYRPAPLDSTVEYEEDFGNSLTIQREYISKKWRNKIDFQIAPLAYSDLELTRAKAHLANIMNRERGGNAIASSDNPNDKVQFESSVDETTREVQSARFLFNKERMRYCDQFQQFFQQLYKKRASTSERDAINSEAQYFFSLMEACAIVYGCSSSEVQEDYYKMFFQLDLNSLYEEERALHERMQDAEQVSAALRKLHEEKNKMQKLESTKRESEKEILEFGKQTIVGSLTNEANSKTVEQLIETVPSLFDVDDTITEHDRANKLEQSHVLDTYDEVDDIENMHEVSSMWTSTAEAAKFRTRADNAENQAVAEGKAHTESVVSEKVENMAKETGISASASTITLTEANDISNSELDLALEPVAELYKTYLSHVNGESPIGSYDSASLHATLRLVKRRRWRNLMDRLVGEEYHTLTEDDLREAEELDKQLHTVKFFDLKIGDTVREVMHVLERADGDGSSLHRTSPYESSSSHPERRL